MTLYGAARLGEYRPNERDPKTDGGDPAPPDGDPQEEIPIEMKGAAASTGVTAFLPSNGGVGGGYFRLRGHTHYEYTNHLGNVLATTSDRKLSIQSGSISYAADVLTLTDYYAFGQAIAARGYAGSSYTYGYQGQEKAEEIYASAVTYKYRVEDSRIGRFFSVDPLTGKYPFYSPYQFSGNRVVDMVELEGLEPANPPLEGMEHETHLAPMEGQEQYGDQKWEWDSNGKAAGVTPGWELANMPTHTCVGQTWKTYLKSKAIDIISFPQRQGDLLKLVGFGGSLSGSLGPLNATLEADDTGTNEYNHQSSIKLETSGLGLGTNYLNGVYEDAQAGNPFSNLIGADVNCYLLLDWGNNGRDNLPLSISSASEDGRVSLDMISSFSAGIIFYEYNWTSQELKLGFSAGLKLRSRPKLTPKSPSPDAAIQHVYTIGQYSQPLHTVQPPFFK